MRLNSVAYLITETPSAHGVYDKPVRTVRKVYCQVRSAWMQEVYQAMSVGHDASKVLMLADFREYKDEPLCRLGDKEYRVLRSYLTPTGGVELTLEAMR